MESLETLPAEPGSYALHLALGTPVCLSIGQLGEFTFPAGDYIYLGSACGPGGLRARIRHHARAVIRHPHWHLDYLRPHAALLGGWYALGSKPLGPKPLECAWSQALAGLRGTLLLARGFGAADCRSGCPAHLVAFLPEAGLANIEARLSSSMIILTRFSIPSPVFNRKVE